jgi:hypothetical protein
MNAIFAALNLITMIVLVRIILPVLKDHVSWCGAAKSFCV